MIMPKSTPHKLAYQKAFNNSPEQVKAQTLRKAAQRAAIKSGASPIGDGKDVIHKQALDNGGGNAPGNLGVQAPAKNRAWRKKSSYKVPNV
jgi:hypothetical protein